MSDVKYQFKGTPGPWKVHKLFQQPHTINNEDGTVKYYYSNHWIMHEADNKIIGEVKYCSAGEGWPNVDNLPQFEANYHLVAAAPDLLEALVDLNTAIDNYWNSTTKPDSLIKSIARQQQKSLQAIHKALNL